MLRKMYLVPPDHYHSGDKRRGHPRERRKRNSRRKKQINPYEWWVKKRHTFEKTKSGGIRGQMISLIS